MQNNDSLFTSSDSVSKETWLAKVAADLKDKSYHDLTFQPVNGITMEPLYTKEEVADVDHSALDHRRQTWQVGEMYTLSESNATILAALNEGVESVCILVDRELSSKEWKEWLSGIDRTYAPIHLYFPTRDNVVEQAERAAAASYSSNQPAPQSLVLHYPLSEGEFSIEKELLSTFSEAKDVAAINVDTRAWHTNSSGALAELKTTADYLAELVSSCPDLAQQWHHLHVDVNVASDYFTELSKLRALCLHFHNQHNEPLFFTAYTSAKGYGQDAHDNLIHATTMTVSALLGGANHMVVAHPQAAKEGFYRRMGRNIQLLLRHESHLETYRSAAQGSYYIERLTQRMLQAMGQ